MIDQSTTIAEVEAALHDCAAAYADRMTGIRPVAQWATLAILSSVTALCIGGVLVSFSVYLPAIAQAEPWSGGTIGGALTVMLLALNVAGIVAGAMTDRTDPRRVLAAGVLMLGLGCWIATTWHTSASFFLGAALLGLGLGAATITPSISILAAVFVHRQGFALGVYFAMLALGATLAPLVQSSLISSYGWRHSLQLTGIAVAVTVVLLYLFPRPPKCPRAVPDNLAAETQQNSGWAGVRNPRFLYLTVGMALTAVSTQGVLYSLVAYLVASGMQSETAVSVLSGNSLLSVPALLAAGILADRWRPERILGVALVAQGLGTLALLAVFMSNPWGMVFLAAFVLLWGVTSGMPSQLAPLILRRIGAPEHYGMLLGVASAFGGTVSAFAPLLTAGLLDAGGGYASVFGIYGAMCLIAIPLFILARRSRA